MSTQVLKGIIIVELLYFFRVVDTCVSGTSSFAIFFLCLVVNIVSVDQVSSVGFTFKTVVYMMLCYIIQLQRCLFVVYTQMNICSIFHSGLYTHRQLYGKGG